MLLQNRHVAKKTHVNVVTKQQNLNQVKQSNRYS